MAANWNPAAGDEFDLRRHDFGAFKLDHVRACAHQPRSVFVRLFRTLLVTAKGHVAKHQRALGASRDDSGVIDHVLHGDGQGRIMALYRHAERIANKKNVNAACVEQRGEARIGTGQHGDAIGFPTHFLQDAGRDFHKPPVTAFYSAAAEKLARTPHFGKAAQQ